ncbi:hypothetical protein ERF60_04980 [Salmonella enterica subsp. enterica serovar Bukavu]|nr:hypothetical protein [Salmonella enterica subsp. enterica serovar Bukavu]ECD3307129.1 hypothetical protein [Salmonella enterica subsp. enterica serovar Bukavu]
MTEWIFNLKTKLTVLVMMLCSLCVTKVYAVEPSLNECITTSGQNINFKNINITNDNYTPGPGTVVSTITQKFTYSCNISSLISGKPPLLLLNQPYFRDFTKKLDSMGLGFQVSVTDAPVLTWDDIKGISQGGNEPKVEFGQPLPPGLTTRTATVKMDFLYLTAYKESSAVYTFSGINNVMNVVPVNYAQRNNGFVLSGFNVRILRNGLGKVDIVPLQVNFGHIYTTYEPSQTRQANFTVIARQVLRPAMGQEFTIPLAITFGKGALTQDTGQTLNLVSLDGPNKGQPNGLRLSIKDDKGKEITFDKQEVLGDITITGTVTGNVSKVYTAVITPTPGGSVKTGKFSAAIPVTVTYN